MDHNLTNCFENISNDTSHTEGDVSVAASLINQEINWNDMKTPEEVVDDVLQKAIIDFRTCSERHVSENAGKPTGASAIGFHETESAGSQFVNRKQEAICRDSHYDEKTNLPIVTDQNTVLAGMSTDMIPIVHGVFIQNKTDPQQVTISPSMTTEQTMITGMTAAQVPIVQGILIPAETNIKDIVEHKTCKPEPTMSTKITDHTVLINMTTEQAPIIQGVTSLQVSKNQTLHDNSDLVKTEKNTATKGITMDLVSDTQTVTVKQNKTVVLPEVSEKIDTQPVDNLAKTDELVESEILKIPQKTNLDTKQTPIEFKQEIKPLPENQFSESQIVSEANQYIEGQPVASPSNEAKYIVSSEKPGVNEKPDKLAAKYKFLMGDNEKQQQEPAKVQVIAPNIPSLGITSDTQKAQWKDTKPEKTELVKTDIVEPTVGEAAESRLTTPPAYGFMPEVAVELHRLPESVPLMEDEPKDENKNKTDVQTGKPAKEPTTSKMQRYRARLRQMCTVL